MRFKGFKLTKGWVLFYKICIVSGLASFPLAWLSVIILGAIIGVEDDITFPIGYALMWLGFGFGCVVFIYPFIFTDMDGVFVSKIKPLKYEINVKTYDEFILKTRTVLDEKGYSALPRITGAEYEMWLFVIRRGLSTLNVIAVVSGDELTEQILSDADEKITEGLQQHFGKKIPRIANTINIKSIFCVNRINSVFNKLLNSSVQQETDLGRFNSGISFGGCKLYIAQQKGGLGKLAHKKYTKEFLQLFSFLFDSQT